jgi:hypothetical protein
MSFTAYIDIRYGDTDEMQIDALSGGYPRERSIHVDRQTGWNRMLSNILQASLPVKN